MVSQFLFLSCAFMLVAWSNESTNDEEKILITPGSAKDDPNINVKIAAEMLNIRTNRVSTNTMNKQNPSENIPKFLTIGKPMNEFPFTLTLKSNKFGFKSNLNSEIALTLRANCRSKVCDLFVVFGIGKSKYISFITDLEGSIYINDKTSTYIYPHCGGNIATGDASKFLRRINGDAYTLRSALAGGNKTNWNILSSVDSEHDGNIYEFPITFELINDPIGNRFTFKMASPSYPNGIECAFTESMPVNEDIKMYITPDWIHPSNGITQIIAIESIAVDGNYFGFGSDSEGGKVSLSSLGSIADIYAEELEADELQADGLQGNEIMRGLEPEDIKRDGDVAKKSVRFVFGDRYIAYVIDVIVGIIVLICMIWGIYVLCKRKCCNKGDIDGKEQEKVVIGIDDIKVKNDDKLEDIFNASVSCETRPLLIHMQTKY